MRNLFLFHMRLPAWMPLDAFSVKDSQHMSTLNPFCLTYCLWNRWWQMFCQPLVSFVQILEKTLWTLKTLLTETFCMQNARLPCETKAPRVSSCLVFCDEEKTIRRIFKILVRASDFFTWLWLYIRILQNHSKMQPQPGDMGPILDHLLGPIIDRFPKLLFWTIYQGQWLEH